MSYSSPGGLRLHIAVAEWKPDSFHSATKFLCDLLFRFDRTNRLI